MGNSVLTTELFCCVVCSADIRSAMDSSSMLQALTDCRLFPWISEYTNGQRYNKLFTTHASSCRLSLLVAAASY